MQPFDHAAFRSAPLVREPFDYLVLPGFIKPEALEEINADFPRITRPGSYPVCELFYGPAFADLIEALNSAELRLAFEDKFAIQLQARPTLITVRGQSGHRDGNIHTDSANKILTVLLYLNSQWEETGGCLRLLRSADDIEDVITEIPPVDGTLVAFRRSANSFHGHKPFLGPRRVVQFNWLTGQGSLAAATLRHRLSAWMKKLNVWSGERVAVR